MTEKSSIGSIKLWRDQNSTDVSDVFSFFWFGGGPKGGGVRGGGGVVSFSCM